jgi:hypothetical protein
MHLGLLPERMAPPRSANPDPAAMARRAFELFVAAARRWGLQLDAQARLLNVSVSTLQRLRRGLQSDRPFPPFDPDHLLRLSLVANIARDLELSLADDGDVAWLNAPNADLDGRTPLAVALQDGLPGLARIFLQVRDWTLGR